MEGRVRGQGWKMKVMAHLLAFLGLLPPMNNKSSVCNACTMKGKYAPALGLRVSISALITLCPKWRYIDWSIDIFIGFERNIRWRCIKHQTRQCATSRRCKRKLKKQKKILFLFPHYFFSLCMYQNREKKKRLYQREITSSTNKRVIKIDCMWVCGLMRYHSVFILFRYDFTSLAWWFASAVLHLICIHTFVETWKVIWAPPSSGCCSVCDSALHRVVALPQMEWLHLYRTRSHSI